MESSIDALSGNANQMPPTFVTPPDSGVPKPEVKKSTNDGDDGDGDDDDDGFQAMGRRRKLTLRKRSN